MRFSSNQIKELNIILKKLEDFRKKIVNIDYIHNKIDFFDTMKDFRKTIVWFNPEIYEVFYHSKFFRFYKDFFTSVHEYYLRSIESMQSLSVMTRWVHNFNSFAEIIDRDILKESFERKQQELDSIDFSKAENFVFVWCGPFPETILYVYENTSIKKILWLDYNHEAIYMAWEMVNWLWLENISFKRTDAMDFDYSEADVISIPLFVTKKDEIINKIIETWKDWVQVLIRSPKGFLNLIYKSLWTNLSPRANITYRKDIVSEHVTEEIIKLEKFNF